MTKKDIGIIRKRLQPSERSTSMIRGCYVDPAGKILTTFKHAVGTMSQMEYEKYMTFFKKLLSGKPDQNLLDVPVPAADDQNEAFRRLDSLVSSGLEDDETVNRFFQCVIDAQRRETGDVSQSVEEMSQTPNMLILLLTDSFDGKFRHTDKKNMQETVVRYILCAVCPVKQGKESMNYSSEEGSFVVRPAEYAVTPPVLGFMYPALQDGIGNLSEALMYTKDKENVHTDFQMEVFDCKAQAPSSQQVDKLREILENTLSEECSIDLVQSVTDSVRQLQEENNKARIGSVEIGNMLASAGIAEDKIESFTRQYFEEFGDESLPASQFNSGSEFRVETENISIRVPADQSELVQTRIIDGKRYIMILADGTVSANGINVVI